IGATTLQTLGHYANHREISLYAASSELGLQQQLPAQALQRLEQFVQTIERTRQACEEHDPVQILRELVDDIGYEAWLHQNASSAKVAEKRMENVHFLLNSIKAMLERDEEEVDLQGAIAKLVLQDLLDRQEEED